MNSPGGAVGVIGELIASEYDGGWSWSWYMVTNWNFLHCLRKTILDVWLVFVFPNQIWMQLTFRRNVREVAFTRRRSCNFSMELKQTTLLTVQTIIIWRFGATSGEKRFKLIVTFCTKSKSSVTFIVVDDSHGELICCSHMKTTRNIHFQHKFVIFIRHDGIWVQTFNQSADSVQKSG